MKSAQFLIKLLAHVFMQLYVHYSQLLKLIRYNMSNSGKEEWAKFSKVFVYYKY